MRKIDMKTLNYVVSYVADNAPFLDPVADPDSWNSWAYEGLEVLANEIGDEFSEGEMDDIIGVIWDIADAL